MLPTLETKLHEHFSFTQFRPGQKEIVESILAGHDTLAIMPTGAGKSLCFQFPGLLLPGITVVISPLIALMKNQVDSLTARGISALFLNSSVEKIKQRELQHDVINGKYKFLYLAPERLTQPVFQQWFAQLPISLIAVDEAHCISSWGHDFRPEYQHISQSIALLPKRPIITAFTATATELVKDQIIERLGLVQPAVFIRGFDRPNLRLFVKADVPIKLRPKEAVRLINSLKGSGIIYTLTIKEAESTVEYLLAHKINAAVYHAKLKPEERTQIQDDFMENRVRVVVATIAFGMGIDKADIRYVIHIGMPPNLERYYQEAGRAGRDDETAYCIILHNGRDHATHHYFIQQSRTQMKTQGKSSDEMYQLINLKYRQLDVMKNYVQTTGCRRKIILEYFQDPAGEHMEKCHGCDRCLDFSWERSAGAKGRGEEKNESENGNESGNKNGSKTQEKKHKESTPKQFWVRDKDELSGTILETVRLYQEGFTPLQITKIRNLAMSTIMNHLAQWYAAGGEFDFAAYIPAALEQQIQAAILRKGEEKLGPIKEALPTSITYDQIRMVLAKREREKRKV